MADGILTSVVRAWDARGELDSDVLALREETQLSETSGGDGVGVPGEPEAPITSGDGGGGNRTRARMTKKKRIVVAPAMNTAMWRHPVSLFFFFFFSCSLYVSLSLSLAPYQTRAINERYHQQTSNPNPPPTHTHNPPQASYTTYLTNANKTPHHR